MCTPQIGLDIGAAAVGVQAVAAKQQIDAQNQAAAYNAQVAQQNVAIQEQNARFAEERAADAERRGAIEEKQHRLRVGKMIGRQRTGFAGSGVVVGEGSPLDVVQDTAAWGELDALTIRHNAAVESYGHRFTAQQARYRGQLYSQEAQFQRAQKRSPWLGVGSTLLTGVTGLAGQYGMFSSSPKATRKVKPFSRSVPNQFSIF